MSNFPKWEVYVVVANHQKEDQTIRLFRLEDLVCHQYEKSVKTLDLDRS